MFIINKYHKIYFDLIEKRLLCPLNKSDAYCETHHILPKSLGGSDEKSNLVNLTAREHYLAHALLTKMTVGKDHRSMMWALHRMIHGNMVALSSRQYDSFRVSWSRYLKENHHSKRIDGWNQKMSDQVTRDWEGNIERRQYFSDTLKETHKRQKKNNPEKYYDTQKKNAALGGQAAKEKISIMREYKGKEYHGWKDLLEKTGVSKTLYNKFYIQGIDPEFRIGKNGKMNVEDTDHLIAQYIDLSGNIAPANQEDCDAVLKRMVDVGLVTSKQRSEYMTNKYNRKEASVNESSNHH